MKVKKIVPGTETCDSTGYRRVDLCGGLNIFGHSKITLVFKECSTLQIRQHIFLNKAVVLSDINSDTA